MTGTLDSDVMTPLATLSTIIFDCADPGALAEFYRKATGWEVTSADDDFVYLGDGGPIQFAFQRVPGLPAPAGRTRPSRHTST